MQERLDRECGQCADRRAPFQPSDPKFTTSPITSEVLDAEDISGRDADGSGHPNLNLKTFGTVKPNAKPGEYKVSFKCAGKPISQYFLVVPPKTLPRASVTVSPGRGVPGTSVNVRVLCTSPTALTSPALAIGDLKRLTEDAKPTQPILTAPATVKNVKPGVYRVSMKCGSANISTSFTVLDPKSPSKNAQVPVKPKGAAETGDLPDA